MIFIRLLLLILLFLSLNFAQKKAFEIEDLYKIKNLSGISVNEDGTKLLFTVSTYFLEKGKSETNINLLDIKSGEMKQLTNSEYSSVSPVFSNDGKGMFFLSSKTGSMQLFYLSFEGGKTEQVTDFYSGISDPKISRDGKLIVFSAKVFPECGEDFECSRNIRDNLDNGPVQAYMADSLMIRHWTDYKDGSYTHIIVFNLETKTYKDLTPGYWDSPAFSAGGGGEFDISPDSKEVVFSSKRVKDPEYSTNIDVYTVNIDGTGLKNITDQNKAWDSEPKYSPDGKYIAYKSQKTPGYESDKTGLNIYNRKNGKIQTLTEKYDDIVNEILWSSNSKNIFFSAQHKGYLPIFKCEIRTGKISSLTEKNVCTGIIADSKDNLFFLSSRVDKPYEIHTLPSWRKEIKQLTFINNNLLEKTDFRSAEEMWIKGADGKPVHVFLIKPHDFNPQKKYPLILNIHGGPQYQWMNSFRGDWQVYPGAGYIVAFPNPHGSTGYGQDYTAAISGDWGGKVYEDIMLVTDSLENLSFVDKGRIGAMGWSYGGYMVNWLQGKTGRFKCFASMMGIFNLETFWGVTEELWFPEWDLKGNPYNSQNYKQFSPSEFIENFKTPTLIITGEKDYRVPYTQSINYFTVLQKLGIESRIIIFKNDGHWPSHIKSMPLYYNAHLEWFHKYLGGGKAPYCSEKLIKNIQFNN